jgi:hypothetical protein
MTQTKSDNRPLPRPVTVGLSALILFHFVALTALVLAAESGPWAMSMGTSMAEGPPFAKAVNDVIAPNYLFHLHMAANYHFDANRPELATVFFEVRLKDKGGTVVNTLKFPEENANYWVRYRQERMAQALGGDQPPQLPQGEQVMPPGTPYPTVEVWQGKEGDPVLRLTKVLQVEIPRDRPVVQPSAWSLLLAKAYVRYLCRLHGAASGELVRYSRNPIQPGVLYAPGPLPRETFEELVCSFGEYRP